MNFRVAAKSFHLTYRGHVDFELLKGFIVSKVGELEWYSIVHENGHGNTVSAPMSSPTAAAPADGIAGNTNPEENEDSMLYEHTHFAFACRRFESRNPRIFDLNDIHCHIRTIQKKEHAQRIFHEYHRKEPVRIEQSNTGNEPGPLFDLSDSTNAVKRIKKAANLLEAAMGFGIAPSSITDIAAIRNERARPTPAEHTHPSATWTLDVRPNWRVLYLWGPSNTGKTTWAVHQLQRPLLISELDELRFFDPDVYDGIIFDDVSFHNCTTESLIHILDWDFTRNIRCRYYNATIPAHTRKIFCSNKYWKDLFRIDHADQEEALRRRLSQVVHVVGKTYIDAVLPFIDTIPSPEPIPDWYDELMNDPFMPLAMEDIANTEHEVTNTPIDFDSFDFEL